MTYRKLSLRKKMLGISLASEKYCGHSKLEQTVMLGWGRDV